MNDDQLTDLKQFITTTVSQQTSELREEFAKLEQKMDDGFAAIGDAISGNNDQLADHETRITNLEAA